MGKVRIYSIAQKLNIKSSVVIDYLKKKGIKAANHFSTIDEETADKFAHEWQQKKATRVKSKIIRPKAAAK